MVFFKRLCEAAERHVLDFSPHVECAVGINVMIADGKKDDIAQIEMGFRGGPSDGTRKTKVNRNRAMKLTNW